MPKVYPKSPARDTSDEAAEQQFSAWRRMGGSRRVEAAFELSETVRGLSLEGLRHRYPDKPLQELHRLSSGAP